MSIRARVLATLLSAFLAASLLAATYALACPSESPVNPKEKTGSENPSAPYMPYPCAGDPVNCSNGNFTEEQTDLALNGRGPALAITRSYNSLAAVEAKSAGPWGFGWSGPYGSHLEFNKESGAITVVQENGATAAFALVSGKYVPGAWIQATLVKEEPEAKVFVYLFTCPTRKSSNSTPKASWSNRRTETATRSPSAMKPGS